MTKGEKNLQSQIVIAKVRIPAERVERRILAIRGMNVIVDGDLAELYEVDTKALNRVGRRNVSRFPEDFMFQLTIEENENLRRQFGTSRSWGGRRYRPLAFTEQGVAMQSSVLRSQRAVQVNIAIMRAFVKLRGILAARRDLALRLDKMEKKYDRRFKVVFDAIRELMRPPEAPRRKIGFDSTR